MIPAAHSRSFHSTTSGGANLIVRAEFDGPTPLPTLPAQTGVMTMWKRIDVELVRMDGAHSLATAVKDVNVHMAPACIQLDFTAESTLPAAETKDPLGPDPLDVGSKAGPWINRAAVFSKVGQKGWFCLAAAKHAHPSAAASTIYDSTAVGAAKWKIRPLATEETIELDKPLAAPNPVSAWFSWTEATAAGPVARQLAFIVDAVTANSPVPGHTELSLRANDIQHLFTGHDADGSLAHAHNHSLDFFPKRRRTDPPGTWAASATAVPDTAKLEIKTRGGVSGISPPVIDGGKAYFAGRTIVYTHHRSYSTIVGGVPTPVGDFNAKILSTVVHEFTHAFGMPHKCGYHDFKTKREKTCFMNYGNTLMIDTATQQMIFGTDGKTGDDLCARHLAELRRVHLEDNKGLKW